jgi:cell wall-associated NlpC family hydrolase
MIAQSLLNTPYLWGGKNAMGLDCSGFTQVVYAAVGVNILRNAREQITQGEVVASLSAALPGDLAFFGYTNRETQAIKITHVGLLLSPTEIIHCAGGRVHIDRIDEKGIYLPDGTMTHHLVQINRYL